MSHKPWSHKRAASTMTNTFPTYDEQVFDDENHASTSTTNAASRIMSSVKRSLSASVPRRRCNSTQVDSSYPTLHSPLHSSSRFRDPTAIPSSDTPSLDQIAMGLHLSRTPHLRTAGVAGKPRSQLDYSPYSTYSPSAPPPSPSVSRSSSVKRSQRLPISQSDNIPIAPVPLVPRPSSAQQFLRKLPSGGSRPPRPRRMSLPPSPLRPSLKKTLTQSSDESIPPTPVLSIESSASASTESSLSDPSNTFSSSLSGRIVQISLKARMTRLFAGNPFSAPKGSNLSDGSASATSSLTACDVASLSSHRNSLDGYPTKKAVRFLAYSQDDDVE